MIMSKTTNKIAATTNYIADITGSVIAMTKLPDLYKARLPLVVTAGFDIRKTELFNVPVLFAFENSSEGHTPKQVSKLLGILTDATFLKSVYVVSDIPAYNIKRLVHQHVDFIVPGKQMFIPSLLIDIKKPVNRDADIKDAITPFTQFMLLYHLEVESIDGMSSKKLWYKFDASYATVNRAVRWMVEHGLAETESTKEHRIRFVKKGRELWEDALQYLTNPVARFMRTDNPPKDALYSGINALAFYTMLNQAEDWNFAISKDDLKTHPDLGTSNEGETALEVWKYDPHKLSNANVVDRLSLYLLLKDNEDERVQMQLENLIKESKWLEE